MTNSFELPANNTDMIPSQNVEANPVDNYPAVTFESITFSDGTTIPFDATDVVVFVGPNNAGKSVALRELEQHLSNPPETLVVKSAKLRQTGTSESFREFLKEHTKITITGSSHTISGVDFHYSSSQSLDELWPTHIGKFYPLFCVRIATEQRITGSNPVNAIDVSNELLSHPIHVLYKYDQIEHRISRYFRRAFGEDLIVDRAAGSNFPLLVGNRLTPQKGEDRISTSYVERLREATEKLLQQGDGMRSFASVVLHLLAPTAPSILLLDEPEAFLHPPQARLLGEIIATERSSRAQIFLATHSADVLHGLINVAPDHLRVLRIRRDGSVNRIKELEKDLVKEISLDPLMKYSSVMSGLFHERVIICESDADCMFYSSLLDIPEVHQGHQPDVLFVHINGKHRMAALAKSLRALDVPVDMIADIDIMREENVLCKVVEALGGNWPQIQRVAKSVKSSIEQRKPRLDANKIKQDIEKVLEQTPATGEFPNSQRTDIQAILRKVSPWDAVKSAGEAALPSGQPTQQFQELQRLCNQIGLWIVPVGELEGFCKSVGNHGPGWVQQVIELKNLADDVELEPARKFVQQIWASRSN